MNETKQKGLVTELQCQTYLTQLGYNVSIPLGEDCRYDMIADINGKLIRIQVKTCHENQSKTGIEFATRSTQGGNTTHDPQSKKYVNEVDYFATFWEGQVYVVPVEETSSKKVLRFESNSNQPNISWAKDYTVEEVLKI